MMYVATTNMVDAMCQKNQWIVSKFGVVIRAVRIRILAMFRMNKAAVAVRMAFSLVFALMFAVDRKRARRR